MHTGITDLSNTVLNQLRKACAAAAASGGGNALYKESADGGLDLDVIYGGDSGPSICSLMEVTLHFCLVCWIK